MSYIIEGEVMDTYGGDYTYRDVWYEFEDGEYTFYERYYGAKPSETEVIDDISDINELKRESGIPMKGDKIIWDSGFGYDIGYYLSDKSNQSFCVTIKNISNKDETETDECSRDEVMIYNKENINKMVNEYGYEYKYGDYEANKLISDFMQSGYWEYHKDWNLLMSVVEKINEIDLKINRPFDMANWKESKGWYAYHSLDVCLSMADKPMTVKTIVEFIEWYNEENISILIE